MRMAFPLVHHLSYSWAGWPAEGALSPEPPAAFFDALRAAWKSDGLELQSHAWTPQQIQMTFRAEPQVAPAYLAARAKGRLQHALRQAGASCGFSRKIAVRSLGDNMSAVVAGYLRHLVAVTADRFRIGKEDFLDKVRAGVFAWAEETGSRLKAYAPMPDHVHVAARGNPERSPLELAEALWRSLNRAAGCCLMGENVYAGTFSEYGLDAVLKRT